jgi:diamine N-acetyltransferase
MPKQARIVAATEADLTRIAALAEVVWRAHYPGIISNKQIDYMLRRMYDLDVMREELRDGIRYDGLLAEEALVAFASYGPVTDEEMKLYKLYVHPEWQRRGFGSQLLRHVEEAARAKGCRTLCLTVNKANAKAIAAYNRNGFSVRKSVVVDIGGGFVMDDYEMVKEVLR